MQGLTRRVLEAVGRSLIPSLRGIALAYTGLAGMLAAVLVVAVAVTPVAPGLQQATEPARQAVSNIVQPTGDALVTLFGGTPSSARPAPSASAFSGSATLDVTIDDTPLEEPSDEDA